MYFELYFWRLDFKESSSNIKHKPSETQFVLPNFWEFKVSEDGTWIFDYTKIAIFHNCYLCFNKINNCKSIDIIYFIVFSISICSSNTCPAFKVQRTQNQITKKTNKKIDAINIDISEIEFFIICWSFITVTFYIFLL